MRKLVKELLLFLLILFLLLTLYSCVALKLGSEYAHHYNNFSPPVCPNTRWVCQEKELYFISDKDGVVTGAGNIAGTDITFDVFFPLPSEGGGFNVYTAFIGPAGPGKATVLWGSASFEEDKCVLKYKARNDYNFFWGEEKGTVTLTFLRENLPEPADFSGSE